MGVPASLEEFLAAYPGMAVRPLSPKGTAIAGTFSFRATAQDRLEVSDSFDIVIDVPHQFPRDIPAVREVGERIPRSHEFHIYDSDGTLCLGSPLRLLAILADAPTLIGFADGCLVPYLYAVSRKLAGDADFAFGELDHGAEGLYDDYQSLLGVSDQQSVRAALRILALKPKRSLREQCPCGCGRQLRYCDFREKIERIRSFGTRDVIRGLESELRRNVGGQGRTQ